MFVYLKKTQLSFLGLLRGCYVMNLQLLQNNGFKITAHKKTILELFTVHKHLDANQIHQMLKEQDISISLATIYRILAIFENQAIITKHKFQADQSTYELNDPTTHHDHLICLKCKHVIEFLDPNIEKLQNQIAQENGFKIINHSLNIYGLCSECQKPKKAQTPQINPNNNSK